MKRYLLIILTLYALLGISIRCLAVDTEGCLVCHRYPGLVKLEGPDKFKVLHIDEERHLNSPHGKVECRKCHSSIIKIPHTDETEVNCVTAECHIKDREEIMAMKSSLSTFHEEERFAITNLEDKSSCRVCHPIYPHSKNHKVRAFLNMHTGYLVCEVCHLKREGLGNLTYEWKSPDSVEFTGGPYGSMKKEEKKRHERKSVISRMLRIFSSREPQPERPQKIKYSMSRIAVFMVKNGEKRILINTEDTERAKRFKTMEQGLSRKEKEKELRYFHRNISKKEVSVVCNECHSPQGILDFRKLGFDEKRTKDLQYMNLKSLVTKYDVFYLPHLFGP